MELPICQKLKRTRRNFSDDERKFIIENYPRYGPEYCAGKLNRTYHSIKTEAFYLKVSVRNFVCPEGMKKCSHCEEILNDNSFYNPRRNRKYTGWCIKCITDARKNRLLKALSNPIAAKEYYMRLMLARSKSRAKRKGFLFDLDYEWIKENCKDFCPIFGTPFFDTSKNRLLRPSIDRVNNNLGYLKSNCVIISWRANIIKNDSTLEELKQIASFYESLFRNRG